MGLIKRVKVRVLIVCVVLILLEGCTFNHVLFADEKFKTKAYSFLDNKSKENDFTFTFSEIINIEVDCFILLYGYCNYKYSQNPCISDVNGTNSIYIADDVSTILGVKDSEVVYRSDNSNFSHKLRIESFNYEPFFIDPTTEYIINKTSGNYFVIKEKKN